MHNEDEHILGWTPWPVCPMPNNWWEALQYFFSKPKEHVFLPSPWKNNPLRQRAPLYNKGVPCHCWLVTSYLLLCCRLEAITQCKRSKRQKDADQKRTFKAMLRVSLPACCRPVRKISLWCQKMSGKAWPNNRKQAFWFLQWCRTQLLPRCRPVFDWLYGYDYRMFSFHPGKNHLLHTRQRRESVFMVVWIQPHTVYFYWDLIENKEQLHAFSTGHKVRKPLADAPNPGQLVKCV